jgi:two-component system cell cycle response regulator DivK
MKVPGSTAGADGPGVVGPLILIIDDNEKNRKLAGDALRAAGLRTIDAASGHEGLALAAERRPDVILLDLRLPDIEGTDVARRLQDGAGTAGIPIVALSALRLADDGASLLNAGFAGVLAKPIDIRAFPEQVRGYCRRDTG